MISALGDKIQAKILAQKANVPTIPGINDVENAEQIRKWMKTDKVAFPIMIKAVAGGGGRGMVKVENKNQLGAGSCAGRFGGREVVRRRKDTG